MSELKLCKDFVWLVLLVSWLPFDFRQFCPGHLDLVEFFSGAARISKIAHFKGYRVRAFDLDYDRPVQGMESSFSGWQKRSCYDMNGEAGFLFLAKFEKRFVDYLLSTQIFFSN